jgi:hypothetical protein
MAAAAAAQTAHSSEAAEEADQTSGPLVRPCQTGYLLQEEEVVVAMISAQPIMKGVGQPEQLQLLWVQDIMTTHRTASRQSADRVL